MDCPVAVATAATTIGCDVVVSHAHGHDSPPFVAAFEAPTILQVIADYLTVADAAIVHMTNRKLGASFRRVGLLSCVSLGKSPQVMPQDLEDYAKHFPNAEAVSIPTMALEPIDLGHRK
jgi:hypothetical protein